MLRKFYIQLLYNDENIKKRFFSLLIKLYLYCLYGLFDTWRSSKINSLDKNIESTNAVIVDFSSGSRMRYNLDYKFFVNEQEFHGSGKHYPKDDTFSIGDTVIIVYDRLNPDNSKTYRDYVSSQEEAPFIMPFLILAGLLLWWRYRKI